MLNNRIAPSGCRKLPGRSDFSRQPFGPAVPEEALQSCTNKISLHSYHAYQPMSSAAFARITRARLFNAHTLHLRPVRTTRVQPAAGFATSTRRLLPEGDAHDPHAEESFEEFTARYGRPYEEVGTVQWLRGWFSEASAGSFDTPGNKCESTITRRAIWHSG